MVRLFAYADHYWTSLVARYYMIDLLEVSLSKFLDPVLGWLREVTDPDKWEMFLADLEVPIPGFQTRTSDASAEEEGASFMAAMNTLRRG